MNANQLAAPRFPGDDALHYLTLEQRTLAVLMSDISERCYCAGWLAGLEFALWDYVLNGPGDWGMDEICADDIDRLKTLSHACGGWIVWSDDACGETFVPIDAWKRLYAEARR